MNWFTRLFRRKPKLHSTPTSVSDQEAKAAVAEAQRPKAGGDIIGRQGGQKRNRAHIYRQPYGYPIRLCDWVSVDVETIERIGEAQGLNGPAAKEALDAALDWAEAVKKAVICKHCRAAVKGKRGPLMGEPGGYA